MAMSKTEQQDPLRRSKAKEPDAMLWICYARQDFWLYLLLLLVYETILPTNFTCINLD